MKKAFIAALLMAAAGSALACSVPNASSTSMQQVIKQHGGWPISDEKCDFLNRHHLYMFVSGDSTVLSGASVGWVSVRLGDVNNVTSDKSYSSTHVNSSQASQDVADDLLYNAVRDAIDGLDFDAAAAQVSSYQRKAAK